MANKILHKRSTVAAKVPEAVDLELGELAINTTDIILYAKETGGNVVVLNSWDNLTEKPTVVATDEANTFDAPQRGTVTTDNDLSFDLTVTNNFTCTPTGAGTLTFTEIASSAGQSGYIKLVNGSNYAIALHASVKANSGFSTTVSDSGTYIISYFCDGTDVYVTTAGAMV